MWPPQTRGAWVLDLDGVVWLSGEAIEGGARAVTLLRDAGIRTLFATNNSSPTTEAFLERLAKIGIDASSDDIVSSADAAAGLITPGSRVFVLADEGVHQALAKRDIEVVPEGPADAVVVGWTHDFDFDRLALAATIIRGGALLIGTNEDPTHPTPQGLLPGGGALLAAVATAAGVEPLVAGKPHGPMADLVRARCPEVAVVVGDRLSTDGALARRLEARFALVLSGVTNRKDVPTESPPDVCASNLVTLVEEFLTV